MNFSRFSSILLFTIGCTLLSCGKKHNSPVNVTPTESLKTLLERLDKLGETCPNCDSDPIVTQIQQLLKTKVRLTIDKSSSPINAHGMTYLCGKTVPSVSPYLCPSFGYGDDTTHTFELSSTKIKIPEKLTISFIDASGKEIAPLSVFVHKDHAPTNQEPLLLKQEGLSFVVPPQFSKRSELLVFAFFPVEDVGIGKFVWALERE